jgi:hypothetical protein
MDRQGLDSSGRFKPRIATLPTFSGTNTQGSTQTGVNGTFTGSGTVAITRQWYRNGLPIPGATNATYVLAAADMGGKLIRFANIARSQYGEVVSNSASRATP